MQFISMLNPSAKKSRPHLRSVAMAAAATLLLAGWSSAAKAEIVLENGDAGEAFSSAQFISSSAFTTPPPANVFGDFPTATIFGSLLTPTGDLNIDVIDFYSFNAVAGQAIQLDIDNAAYANSADFKLSLFSGNGALIAENDDSPLDPGSSTRVGDFGTLAPRDPFIGTYTLTYPNTNREGVPVSNSFDPNQNTYYVAVTKGSRFGTFFGATSSQESTTSPLTRPDGMSGGTAIAYPSGYNIGSSNTVDDTLRFTTRDTGGNSPYMLQVSLGAAPATAPVPEPGTMALMGLGLAGLAASRRRKKNKAEASAAAA